jgi:hypothetical protein
MRAGTGHLITRSPVQDNRQRPRKGGERLTHHQHRAVNAVTIHPEHHTSEQFSEQQYLKRSRSYTVSQASRYYDME